MPSCLERYISCSHPVVICQKTQNNKLDMMYMPVMPALGRLRTEDVCAGQHSGTLTQNKNKPHRYMISFIHQIGIK